MSVPAELVVPLRIVEAAAWLREPLNLCGPAFLPFDAHGTSDTAFGVRTAVVNTVFIADGIDWNGQRRS